MTDLHSADLGSCYSRPVNATANRRRLQWSVVIFLLPTLVYPLLGGAIEGRATTEKIITAWFMPIGIVWLLLLALTLFLWNSRLVWATRLSLFCFFVLTLASNSLVAGWLIGSLEAQVTPWRLDRDKPLDAVVVLGGDTRASPAYGRVEAGDRVLYAAEVYHQKKAPLLIATGKSSIPERADPSQDTKEIWVRLGIPETAIEVIGGPNTAAELRELKSLLGQGEGRAKRVGILTSAFHLPRVMRLAKANDLALIPLAADHRHDPEAPIRFQSFLPSDDALQKSKFALKEYLAALADR